MMPDHPAADEPARMEHTTPLKGDTMKRILVIAVLALAAVTAGSFAYAAIPSASGVISACKAKDGAIKLIDKEAGQNCAGSQQLVQWNQQGPPGTPIGTAKLFGDGTLQSTSYPGQVDVAHGATGQYDFTVPPSLLACNKWIQITNGPSLGAIYDTSATTFRVNLWHNTGGASNADFTVFFAC